MRPGGTVIVAAPCPDGLGSDGPFYDLVKEANSPGEVLEKLRQPGFFVHDQMMVGSLGKKKVSRYTSGRC